MKVIKTLLVLLLMAAFIFGIVGCQKAAEEKEGTQTVAVIRGNLTQEVTAAGNLALAHTEDVAVDIFYPTGTKGTIGEVLVETGDSVVAGQVLVTMDKSEWNDQLATLEDLVTTKERALVQAQINLKTAEQTLKNTRDTITTKEIAVVNAEISLQQAETTLATSIISIDYESVLAELRKARTWWEYVTTTYKTLAPDPDDYTLVYELAEERLQIAQTNYDNLLAGYNEEDVTLKKNQVKAAQMTLELAQTDLIDAQDDVTLKELSLTLTQGNLADAEKALTDAKDDLADALGKSPDLIAPFDGFVTQVNVAGGDEVLNGTIAVQIADPNKFEASILVSENDINKITVGSKATVSAYALTNTILTATVTHVSPTATISSGVVNYTVKVEIDPLGASPFGSFGQFPGGSDNGTFEMPDFSSGDFSPPEGFEPPEGFAPGDFSPPEGFEMPDFSAFAAPADVQLREGLTVTVSITIASRTDVLLVPNGAITPEGFKSYVTVVKSTGETEKREITIGISNWIYSEITAGLEEGEQVEVALNLAPEFDFPGGGMMFMGGR